MSVRAWIAMIIGPMLAALVYAWLTMTSLPVTVIAERPTITSLFLSGALVALVFEIAVVVPLFLVLRRTQRLSGFALIVLCSAAWFALCFSFLVSLGGGASDAAATALLMLPPGIVLVVAFWFIGVGRGA